MKNAFLFRAMVVLCLLPACGSEPVGDPSARVRGESVVDAREGDASQGDAATAAEDSGPTPTETDAASGVWAELPPPETFPPSPRME
jgi:hypothetical protein